MRLFEAALNESGPSVTPEMEEEYRRMAEQLKQESPRRGERMGLTVDGE